MTKNEAIVENMMRLETEVASLSCMANILVELLDQNIVDSGAGNGNYHVILNWTQMEMLTFAWNEVGSRATRLDKAFIEAFKVGEPALEAAE